MDYADMIHQQLASPFHKTTRAGQPLTCICGRAFSDEILLNRHQLKPSLSVEQLAAWNGDPNA